MKPEAKNGNQVAQGTAAQPAESSNSALWSARKLLMREQGQTLAEYSLILSVLSLGLFAVLLVLAGEVTGFYEAVDATVSGLNL